MAQVGSEVREKLIGILTGGAGLDLQIGQISEVSGVSLDTLTAEQVLSQNIAPELAEKSTKVRYPALYVYTARIQNQLKEKFRRFSGTAEVVMELRITHEHANNLERDLQLYLEAVTSILDNSRGDWGGGMFFSGAYEITLGPIKPGGKNYVQTAKVKCEVNVSVR